MVSFGLFKYSNLPSDTNDFLSTAALAFSPDGSLLMSCHTPGSDYSSITLWETKTWKVARAIPTEKSGGGCTAAGFTSDGKHIVRLTQKSRTQPGNTIEVYSTDSWKLIAGVRTFPWYVTNLALPLLGNQIAVAGRMGEVNKEFSSEMTTFQNSLCQERRHWRSWICLLCTLLHLIHLLR
jgi:WD40 repeat protein